MGDAQGDIFSDCSIALVPSHALAPRMISQLSSVLEGYGATICEPRRDGSLPIEKVTHILSNTIDFPQYVETQAIMLPVVTTQWVKASIARRRVSQVRPFSPDPRMIFAEVVVTCANLPARDQESIVGATMALGGQEAKEATRATTHICALSMDNPKVVAALEKGFKGSVVLPHWFDACFKLGKRIDEGPYLLPDPDVLKMGPEEELLIPINTNLDGATSVNPQWLPLPSDSKGSRPPATVFQDRSVFLSNDLGINARLTTIIADIIDHGGGRVVEDVEDCDIFVCQYRDGPQYIQACQSCKEVGSLSWLYYLIVLNQWRNPLHRLLHYPIPRNGIDGFRDLRICISNYGGEARIYLENLIKACGAVYTKAMKADNTHLVTARNTSDKCRAAPEWGVAIVNHLWVEESYAKCDMKPINIPKYNHFPPRTNLGEISQTFLDESRLRSVYYPAGEETMSPRVKRRRKILEAAEDNAYQRGPAEGVVIGHDASASPDFEVRQDDDPAAQANRSTALETPIRARHVRSGKENDTPSVLSGGRSAKAKARDLLQCIAPDIALYEKEKKRHSKTGSAPWGGKRAADQVEKEKEAKAAAKAHQDGAAVGEEEVEAAKRPVKKLRPSLLEVEMRLVVTGFTRWVGDRMREDHDRKKLRDMGIRVVQEGQPCEYVAAPSVMRTVKFLCALARGARVLSTAFIEAALQLGQMPNPEEFLLRDGEAEKRYKMKLAVSSRAKSHRGRLLRGMPVYCTEKIPNGPDSFRAIAEANGAQFLLYRARGASIRPTTAEDGHALPEPVYLLSGDSKEERQLWPRFRKMATRGNMEPRVVTADWLLDVAMAQQVRFDPKFLVDEGGGDEGGGGGGGSRKGKRK